MIIVPAGDYTAVLWQRYRERAKHACEQCGVTPWEDMERNTLNGPHMMWVVIDNNEIHGIVTIARIGEACEIVQCIGAGIHKFIPLLTVLEQFARDQGLKVMRVFGRKGWKRILKDYTVMQEHPTYSVFERPL